MATGDFGGNGSVQWLVDVDNARHGQLKQGPKGPKGWKHEGVDETNAGEKFTVGIEIPVDRIEFVATLKAAAALAETASAGTRVSFKLPIESNNPDQIRIQWNSKP